MEIIAHRGDKRYTPENTMAAFQSAYSYPIDGIELDLQLTKDGVPIVIHDSTLDRTTNGWGQIKNFAFREIKELDAGSWFKENFKGEKVPSFEEVIHWLTGKEITLHVELKNQPGMSKEFLDIFLEMVDGNNLYETVIVSSFNHSYITYLKERRQQLTTALLTRNPFFRANHYAKKIKADAIHIRNTYHAMRFYQSWTSKGLPVRVYNVQKLKVALECQRLNINSIISNDPKKMTEIFIKEKI